MKPSSMKCPLPYATIRHNRLEYANVTVSAQKHYV